MKKNMAFFAISLTACVTSNSPGHPKSSPAQVGDRKSLIIVHKRTKNFIDIEAPIDNVWIGCNQVDLPKENSFMTVLVKDEDMIYDFFSRRPYNVKLCLEKEREYRRISQNAKTVRVVGIHPLDVENPISEEGLSKRIPRSFQVAPRIQQQVFVRIEARGRCGAYFADDCDLPKNYWAGTIPE